ncbi:hypothetical protein EST38_g9156 [Candolleomyces aberdarensis]|uniref:ATP-dependent DNA helicase n=1 Tax=Candolleomyces aberdarensis TaxID=2316362 RepID=A0A4Q2DCV0_9AGAR|nr:hypothetical protein EST38_g9156 [Candolleomyces aberdarensis]
MYTSIDQQRLMWIKRNQARFRSALLNHLEDANMNDPNILDANNIGQHVFLPSSYTGGPQNMAQNYQDSMAIARFYGKVDLFLMMTTNPKWPEIERELLPGQTAYDRPDLVVRVLQLKKQVLLDCIIKGKIYGEVDAYVYSIEFQKHGLPHMHLLLFLKNGYKLTTPEAIDSCISAQWPDREQNPLLFDTVLERMVHGPCGAANPNAPCMVNGKCSKCFPQEFNEETTMGENGYARMARPDNGVVFKVRGIWVDNRWIVAHPPALCAEFDCHINLECAISLASVHYSFKYLYKGPNCRSAEVSQDNKVKMYVDGRYISATDAVWRIFHFPIHEQHPPVVRLQIHLPGEQNIVYSDNQEINEVLAANANKHTTLTALFEANADNGPAGDRARTLTQPVLLANGATSFEDLRHVPGHSLPLPTFYDTCIARGLFDDGSKWRLCLLEACKIQTGSQLQHLFVTLLLFGHPTHPHLLWNKFKGPMSDDLGPQIRAMQMNVIFTPEIAANYALFLINNLLQESRRLLRDFPHMPLPVFPWLQLEVNPLIAEQLDYDKDQQQEEHDEQLQQLNKGQRAAYNRIIDSIENETGDLFFLEGSGGTGKMFVYNMVCCKVRSEGKIVLLGWLGVGHGHNMGADKQSMRVADAEQLIKSVYSGIDSDPPPPPKYFTNRMILMILLPRNVNVAAMNEGILNLMAGEPYQPPVSEEFMWSITSSSLPPGILRLKVGCPVICLCNLDPSEGHCNGTCLIIASMHTCVLQARIIGGDYDGQSVLIPHISLIPSKKHSDVTFNFHRLQFPVRLAFSLSINKAQGQTVRYVGLDLQESVFSHGMPNLSLGNSGSSARRGRKSASNSTPSSSTRSTAKNSKPVITASAQSVFHGLATLSNPRIGGTSQTYVFNAKICFEGMEAGKPLRAVLSYYNKQKLKFYPEDSMYCFIVARLSTINPNNSLELYHVTDSGQRMTSCAGVHLVGDIDKLTYLLHKGEDNKSDEEDGPSANQDVIVIDSDDEDADGGGKAKSSDNYQPIFPPRPQAGCPKFSIEQPVVFSVSGVASNCNSNSNTFSIITKPFISLIPRGDAAKKPMPWDNKFVTVVGTLIHVIWGKNEKVVQLKLDIDDIVFLGSYGPDLQLQPTIVSNTLDPKTPAASKDTSKVTVASSSSSSKAKGKGKLTLTTPHDLIVTFPVAQLAASAATTMLLPMHPSPSVAVGTRNDQLIILNELLQQYLNAAVASQLSALPTPPTPPPFYVPPQHPYQQQQKLSKPSRSTAPCSPSHSCPIPSTPTVQCNPTSCPTQH